jgi:hypothetical protein
LAAATAAAGVELLPALPANPAKPERERCKALDAKVGIEMRIADVMLTLPRMLFCQPQPD